MPPDLLPALAGLLIAVTIVFGFVLLVVHLGFRAPRVRERGDPGQIDARFDTVAIPSVAGKRLFGWFLHGDRSDTTVIILHGWGANAEMMLPLARPFQRAGLHVLLFDTRNHGRGDSGGISSLPRFAEDLDHVIDWLRRGYPVQSRRLVLLGHSVGAGAVLLSASRRDDIDAVIPVSAFAHPRSMMRRFLKPRRVPDWVIDLILRYVQWIIGYHYEDIAPVNTVCHIHCPILLVHGRADRTVPVSDALAIERACPTADIELLLVDGADHESVERIDAHSDVLVRFALGDPGIADLQSAHPSSLAGQTGRSQGRRHRPKQRGRGGMRQR